MTYFTEDGIHTGRLRGSGLSPAGGSWMAGSGLSPAGGGIYGSGLYDRAANWATSGNKLYPGEKHPLMWVDGKFQPGSFLGPGTHIVKRVRNNDKPISPVDAISENHDISYTLAKDVAGVRKADEHMIDALKRVRKAGTDNLYNITLGNAGIKSKMFLENRGVNPTRFTDFGAEGVAPADLELMKKRHEELNLMGYGRGFARSTSSGFVPSY